MIRLRLSETLLGHLAAFPACLCPTVEDGLMSGTLLLERAGVETARLDAECLLAHVLGCPRWRLLTEGGRRLSSEEFRRYVTLLHRRELRQPLAYLIGTREFWSLPLAVSPGVLVPRPETETLVETTLSLFLRVDPQANGNGSPRLRAGGSSDGLGSHPPILVDLCTGSGAVAIALARDLPDIMLFATDVSRRALRVARSNAEANGVGDRITFLRGDLWCALDGQGLDTHVDLVVSNPPYIPSGILPTLLPEIQWEPRRALDGGWDGLEFHRAIIAGAPQRLRRGGFLLLEIGADQAAEVRRLVEATGAFESPGVLRDLGGRDRVVKARRRAN
jgi:release factor glutamine methyltransferase